jgi:hypothetical protein
MKMIWETGCTAGRRGIILPASSSPMFPSVWNYLFTKTILLGAATYLYNGHKRVLPKRNTVS